jgi:hypothetical protein
MSGQPPQGGQPEMQINPASVFRRLGERISALEIENAQLQDVIEQLVASGARLPETEK